MCTNIVSSIQLRSFAHGPIPLGSYISFVDWAAVDTLFILCAYFFSQPPPSPMFYLFISAFHIWSSLLLPLSSLFVLMLRTITHTTNATLTNHNTARDLWISTNFGAQNYEWNGCIWCALCVEARWADANSVVWEQMNADKKRASNGIHTLTTKKKFKWKKFRHINFVNIKAVYWNVCCVFDVSLQAFQLSQNIQETVYMLKILSFCTWLLLSDSQFFRPLSLLLACSLFPFFLHRHPPPSIHSNCASLFLTMVIPSGLSRLFALYIASMAITNWNMDSKHSEWKLDK